VRFDPEVPLSGREHEVLALVGAGLTTAAIAAHLALSRDTVNSHVKSARTKLGAETRLQAALLIAGSGSGRRARELAVEDRRILELLAEGKSLVQAARALHMSRRTATRRLAGIRRTLGVRSTCEALLAALERAG
jgi:DNA-binding CsgD family transcriptional regulator